MRTWRVWLVAAFAVAACSTAPPPAGTYDGTYDVTGPEPSSCTDKSFSVDPQGDGYVVECSTCEQPTGQQLVLQPDPGGGVTADATWSQYEWCSECQHPPPCWTNYVRYHLEWTSQTTLRLDASFGQALGSACPAGADAIAVARTCTYLATRSP